MMNERKLAWKYLCKKKSRSIATLFAIALSAFIIFVSGNLIMGSVYAYKQVDLKRNGNHIAYLEEMNMDQISVLEKEDVVICAIENRTCYSGEMGMDGGKWDFNYYYFEDFSKFPFHYEIIQGNIPQNPGEIMLSEEWKYYLGKNYKIGDRVTVELTERKLWLEQEVSNPPGEEERVTKTYTLAGYYKCPDDSWLGREVVLVKDEPRNSEHTYRVYITSEEEGIEDLETVEGFEEKEGWARSFGEVYGTKVEVNWLFEKSQSEETAMWYCLVLIFAGFIGGFAAIVIRNSFVMSVVERTRDYGMLRCIGASKRQIRKVAFYEAFVLGIVGEVIGILFSYVCLYFGIRIGKQYIPFLEEFKVIIDPILIIGTCLVILLVVLFGLLEPTRQMNKLNALNALRNQKDIKKTKVCTKRRKGLLIRRIFGVEGEYAYKNLMRNPKRFFAATAACMVGVTFFVGINAAFIYSKQMFEEIEIEYGDYNMELCVNPWCVNMEEFMEKLGDIEGVSNVHFFYDEVFLINDESPIRKMDDSKIKYVEVIGLDETKSLIKKESVEKGEVGELKSGECYLINWGTDSVTKERLEICEVSIDDKIQMHKFVLGQDESYENTISELTVKAVLKEQPYANTYGRYPVLVVSEDEFEEICKEQDISSEGEHLLRFKMDEECDTDKVKDLAIKYGMRYYDELEDNRRAKKEIEMTRLITNVVLILVALVSSMNLFNSMEYNHILREKERRIMRMVGMSLKQYRKMILLEGMLSVIIAFILGSILGTGFGYGIYNIIALMETELKFVVPVGSIVVAGIGLTLLTLFSSLGGMKKESRGKEIIV